MLQDYSEVIQLA
jgi:hypothetical protein